MTEDDVGMLYGDDVIEDMSDGRFINMNISPISGVEGVVVSRWDKMYTPLKNALFIVLANAVASASGSGCVRYSRNTGVSIPRRYNKKGISVKTYIKAVSILENDGWIKNFTAPRNTGRDKISSRYSVTNQLVSYFSLGDMLEQEKINLGTAETIIIRNKFGELIEYRETTNIAGMRNVVTSLNLVNNNYKVEHLGKVLDAANMVRIFKGTKTKGGRWYRCDIQQIKQRNADGTDLPIEQTRLGVLIDGGHVIEVDFNSLHPLLLCAKNNIMVDGLSTDIYRHILGEYNTNKVDRAVIKDSLLRILNVNTPEAAKGTIQKVLKKFGDATSFMLPSEVYNKIKQALPELYPYFHSKDQGLTLQYMDSMIVEEVANVFIEAGKPLLPVHDSFVVKEEDENMLIKAMCQSFRKVTGNDNIPIGLKIKRWDGSQESYID